MKKKERAIHYVNMFNDGEIDDLLEMLGDIRSILIYFHKLDVINLVDPFDNNLSDYQNEILNYMLNVLNDKGTLDYCVSKLSDVIPSESGYYLSIGDREDLSKLFDDRGRDTTARDIVKSMFDEDDSYEPYDNTTDDVYNDVINELNPENIEHLKTYILDRLTNWKIEVDDECPDLFQNYVEEDGFFYLTPENVGDVIGNEESMKYLMDGDLSDLDSELYSIHSNAYNSAYETEMYDVVMGELETFFDAKSGRWNAIPLYGNKDRLVEHYQINFNPNEVINSIKKYVADTNLWGYYDNNFDNVGSWLNMMDILMDGGDEPWLDFRIPDYADSRLVDKYINEIFYDYI
jgi:hypothetical protein